MRKTVVVWANCQGGAIITALKESYSDIFDVHWFMNYEYIKNGVDLPEFMKIADIFLYQNYRSKENSVYDLDWISRNILPASCQKIAFPTLHSISLQFCHDFYEPENSKTISKDLPHGAFMYGIKPVADHYIRLSGASENKEYRIQKIKDAVRDAMSENFISLEDVAYHKNRSFEFLSEKSKNSDIPKILEYIMDNYKTKRLWHNPYHPNEILQNELCQQIFDAIGVAYKPSESLLSYFENNLKDWVMPILPSVQKHIGITAGSYCESMYHPEIKSSEDYLSKYLHCLYV